MTKVVWTVSLAALCLGVLGGPASAQTMQRQRGERRVERQERVRQRMEQRREALRQRLGDERFRRLEQRRQWRLDRNADGRLSRREIARYRSELRRAIRRSIR